MILSVEKSGAVRSIPAALIQGSFPQDVTVVAPFTTATCILRLKPPSEKWLEDVVMAPTVTEDGEGVIFTGRLPSAVATTAGRLLYQLEFVGRDGESVSSERGSVNILPGVVTDMPSTVGELSQYSIEQLYALLARLGGNVVGLRRSVGEMMTSVPLTLRLGRVLWSGGHATIDVPQVTERSVITVSYVPEDAEEYVRCGIACVRQYEGGLVFSAESTPTRDVSVQVIVMDDLRFGDVYDPLPYVELETLVMNGSASASVVSERLVLI